MTLSDRFRDANWALFALAIALTAVGVATIAEAAADARVAFAWLQVRWAVVAAVAAVLVFAVPYPRWVASGYVLYAAGLLGLVVVLVAGTGRGAARWIDVGAFRVQPSEFMKLILVVALAGYVRYEQSYKRFRGLAWPFALTLVPVALVMKQPDLGTGLLLVPILFVALFVAGARLRHLSVVAAMGVVAALFLYFVPGLMEPYQKDRVRHFLAQDAGGETGQYLRRKQGLQLFESKIAVSSGGLAGVSGDEALDDAIGRLPERHTDFVFPVLAARWGLLGVTVLFLLEFAFLAALLATAARVREPAGRMLAVGVFTLFATQVVVNLGMTVGMLPVVGVTLPFVSYGGSSLLTSFLAVGLVMGVAADRPIELGVGDFD